MRMRRGRLLVLLLAVVLALGGGSVAVWATQRPVPVVLDPACPAFLTHTSNATEDFGDTVEWGRRTYWRSDGSTRAADRLGVVTCSVLADRGNTGWRVAPGPWPDGAATVLPRGTPLHLPTEDRGGRGLVARTSEGDVLYCVEDDQASGPTC